MRIFAVSDLHVDYKENRTWVAGLSDHDFVQDALILAGDVSDRTELMADTLEALRRKFARVFFVPGNHDLWVRPKASGDSLDKFEALMALCDQLAVETQPANVGDVQIVPLFSWYEGPEDHADSLYVAKEGEDPDLRMWSDKRLIGWPDHEDPLARYMLAKNLDVKKKNKKVITFSHFLPRKELIFGREVPTGVVRASKRDPHPKFNFSRVAGTEALDRQIRHLGSTLHVYGHQHRNRQMEIEGVTYLSHCVGYARERRWGLVCEIDEGPQLVWEG